MQNKVVILPERRCAVKATYKDVKSDILSKITTGEWEPGNLVPNEVDLAATYGCARATVNRAMRELADDGLIERRRKAGTRVRMTPIRQARFDIPIVRVEIEEKGAEYRYSLVSSSVEPAPDWLRARLNLSNKSKVLRLVCMHYADGDPYQHEDRWINLTSLPQAQKVDFSDVGPNEWLVSTIPFSDVEISFSAGLADQRLTDYLACAKGDPVFTIERSTWWEGQAVTYVRLTYKPGHRLTTRY
jgi:GntR family histidine utilization transcriptional repressor